MKAFIGKFLGFECKEGVQLLKSFFPDRLFDPRVLMDRGLKDESRNEISAQNSI